MTYITAIFKQQLQCSWLLCNLSVQNLCT